MGLIIRIVDVVGVYGVIILKRRFVYIIFVVVKVFVGVVEYMLVCKVINIVNIIKRFKEEGLWIVVVDMDGEIFYK